MNAMMQRQALLEFIVGALAFSGGYFCAAMHRIAEPERRVLLGEFNAVDPRLKIWLDFGQFSRKTTPAAVRDLAAKFDFKLDVDWKLVPETTMLRNSTGCYGSLEELLDTLFERRMWCVQANTLIVRYPLPPDDDGAVVRVYDISPTLGRFQDELQVRNSYLYAGALDRDDADAVCRQDVSDVLQGLIEAHVEPYGWGTKAHNCWFQTGPGCLVICATPQMHARIERLIQLLNGEK